MLTEPNSIYDGFKTLERGMDSGRAPALIPPNQAAFLVNSQTRTGFISNRPGWSRVYLTGDTFQFGRWQGASAYISEGGRPYLVASIGGYIVRFDVINNTALVLSDSTLGTVNPSVRSRAWFVQAEKYLCIQDNASIPLVFDGATLRRGQPVAFGGQEFPVGNIMEYNNGRLWVALPDGRSFVGGDLAYSVTGDASDVLLSTQNQFLTSGSFALPATAGFITAMRSIANQDSVIGQGPLIVCGQYGAATVNAPFNADAWQNTDSPIVSLGLLSQGPSGQDACVNINGDLWYRSPDGIRSFMIARRDHGTWVNTPLSHEMDRVLIRDDPYLLDWVSGVQFDNRLLMTTSPFRATHEGVQYGNAFRGLTVLDFTRVASMFDRTQPTWEGIWNGLSILQILTVNCWGKDRCFMFVMNDCFQIELWELSTANKFDNLTDPIQWSAETRSMGFEDQAEFLKQLVRTETWIENLVGTLTYSIRYRPDGAQAWQTLDAGSVCATSGMCAAPGCDVPQGPLPQYRPRKISSSPSDTDCEECTQKQYRNGFEYQFQLEFTGAASVRRFRAVATRVIEEVTGGCIGTEDCCAETGCELNPWEYRTEDECTLCDITISEITQVICNVVIITQPDASVLADEGETVNLSFTFDGVATGVYTVQWYKDDVALEDGPTGDGSTISGATTTDLTITDAQPEDSGNYYAVVTDTTLDGCEFSTDTSEVTAIEAPTVPLPTAYWKMDEINEPIVGGEGPATDRAEQLVGATLLLASGTVPAFEDAVGGSAASAYFKPSGELNTGLLAALTYTTGDSFSFAFWFKFKTDPAVGDEMPRFGIWNSSGDRMIDLQSYFSGPDRVLNCSVQNAAFDSDQVQINPWVPVQDQWYFVAGAYDGATSLLSFYLDNVLIGTTSTPVVMNTSATSQLFFDENAGFVETLVSQVAFWSGYKLTVDDVNYLFNTAAGRTCCPFA